MTDFGIKAAALAGLHLFEHASRRSGRTTLILDSLKDSDTLIVATVDEVRRLGHELKERGRTVDVLYCRAELGCLYEKIRSVRGAGRIVLDHSLIHLIYIEAIENTASSIAHLTQTPVSDPRLEATQVASWNRRQHPNPPPPKDR